MARALIIYNPVAARADSKVVQSVTRLASSAGWEVDVAGTTRPGHAAELARQGVEDQVDVIAVYGGDGTTIQAVHGMVGHDVPLGIIPGGTGNLLAANLRLPRNPTAAARVILQGVPRRIDLGRMPREDGEHYFAVACGAGFDAELMASTTGAAKRRWRMGAYVARTVVTLGRIAVDSYRITVDGEVHEARAASVLVANCGDIIPPFLKLKHDIAIDDGIFDVVVLRAGSALQAAHLVWQLATGRVNGSNRVTFHRGRRVTVESESVRPVQHDGEPAGVTPFTAEVVPGAIRVVVPRE